MWLIKVLAKAKTGKTFSLRNLRFMSPGFSVSRDGLVGASNVYLLYLATELLSVQYILQSISATEHLHLKINLFYPVSNGINFEVNKISWTQSYHSQYDSVSISLSFNDNQSLHPLNIMQNNCRPSKGL